MPHPDNIPDTNDMLNMPAGELAQMPVEQLAELQGELAHASKQLKAATARFNAALEVRYGTIAADERRARGKDTGTVRLQDGDFTIVADLPKRVEWDQPQLAAMVGRIRAAGDDPAQYVDVTIRVPERKYAAWPQAIRQGFEPARTVKTGTLKVSIEPNEAAQ